MHPIFLLLAVFFIFMSDPARAGFDFDRRVSAEELECETLFEKPCGINGPDRACVVQDSVVVVWEGGYNAENGVLYADRSSDGGRAWGTDVTLIDQQRSIEPRAIAVSPNDPATVVIAWVTYAGLGVSLFLDFSYDWMRTFAYPKADLRAANGVANTAAADIAIGNMDTLVVVFARRDTLWAKFSTLTDPSAWSDSVELYRSVNVMEHVDIEAGADGTYGVVWREKVGGRGVIRALTFEHSMTASMHTEPLRADLAGHRRWPIQIVEREAINTFAVSDDSTLDYAHPTIRSLPSESGSPGAWWVAFHEKRGRIFLDRRSAAPIGEWGMDIPLEAPNVDMPALALAQEGGVEFVIVAYRQWESITMVDVAELDGELVWTDRESVSAGHSADRVHGHAAIILNENPLQFGVVYTPINHNG
ncbi:MAG: hypothetical protein AAB733_01130, partial [Patescibacteria group bacterium]